MPFNPDPTPDDRSSASARLSLATIGAFAIHVLTASGAAFALLALFAATAHQWPRMFMWLGIALFVDAIDGPLARRYKVSDVLPRWSGDALDFVVDFVTYVFVPAYAIAASGLLPEPLALAAGLIITVVSTLYFADRNMKTADNYFRGFPVLWNVVAFYLLLLKPPPWVGFGMIAVLAILTFVSFPFIHPIRVARLRYVNVGLLFVGSVLAVVALLRDMAPGIWISGPLCAIGLYILVAGFLRGRET
jgi:phosphatidylcholine synthase